MKCHFCSSNLADSKKNDTVVSSFQYRCRYCGDVLLTEEAADDFAGEKFSKKEKEILSCVLRIESEKRGGKPPATPLDLDYLHRAVEQYRPLDPLEKMDYALQRINRTSQKVGQEVPIDHSTDFPLFHCYDLNECFQVLSFLTFQRLIKLETVLSGKCTVVILPEGYERLREIQQAGHDSTTCFVAMWFTPEMQKVYDQAVKPAVEFVEEGQIEPRFKATKIDREEHINDINDEIIATIRRSRFMVCDLTGYRGGVYFEAGFAHGLGIQVIYTCREDWCSEDKLKDEQGRVVETLKDSSGRDIRVKKEGVHFDLAHRNRIPWEEDKLGEFRKALEVRIKAVIV